MPYHFTKENAMQMVEKRRLMGIKGGRPPGVLNKKTIKATTTKEAFTKIMQEKAGLIGESLLQNLIYNKDTTAGSILLDRAFGKVPQGVQMQVATFSLKELAEYRKSLNNPPQDVLPVALQVALPDVLQEPKDQENNDVEKKTT